MSAHVPTDFHAAVNARRTHLSQFMRWAAAHEGSESQDSLRAEARSDIRDTAEALHSFPESWWGIIVFSCFGSLVGVRAVAGDFQYPVAASKAESALDAISFPKGFGRSSPDSARAQGGQARSPICVPARWRIPRNPARQPRFRWSLQRTACATCAAMGPYDVLRSATPSRDSAGEWPVLPAGPRVPSGFNGPSVGLRNCLGDQGYGQERGSL